MLAAITVSFCLMASTVLLGAWFAWREIRAPHSQPQPVAIETRTRRAA